MPAMAHRAHLACRIGPYRVVARRVLVPWVLQGRRLEGDVLEVGCGSGAMAAELLRRSPTLRLTATDVDPAMVAVATAQLAPFGARATVHEADATALPFDAGSFDAVVSCAMLHHVLDWEGALAEIARVLRPGGTFVGYDVAGSGTGRLLNGHDHGTRRMGVDELRAELDRVGLVPADVQPQWLGRVARFAATKG